jgi:hypothetical protein
MQEWAFIRNNDDTGKPRTLLTVLGTRVCTHLVTISNIVTHTSLCPPLGSDATEPTYLYSPLYLRVLRR